MRRGLLVSVFVVATVTAGVAGVVIGRNTAAAPSEPVRSLSPRTESVAPTESPAPTETPATGPRVGIVGTFTYSNFTGEYMPASLCQDFAGARVIADDGQATFLGDTTTSKAVANFGYCSVEFILQVPKAPVYVLLAHVWGKGAPPLRLVYTYQELRRVDFRIQTELSGE